MAFPMRRRALAMLSVRFLCVFCDADIKKTSLFFYSGLGGAFFMGQNVIFESYNEYCGKFKPFCAVERHQLDFIIRKV